MAERNDRAVERHAGRYWNRALDTSATAGPETCSGGISSSSDKNSAPRCKSRGQVSDARLNLDGVECHNYALVRSIGDLFNDRTLLGPYDEETKHLGDELAKVVDEGADDTLAGDRRLSRLWAERLGFADWFEWRRLQEFAKGLSARMGMNPSTEIQERRTNA